MMNSMGNYEKSQGLSGLSFSGTGKLVHLLHVHPANTLLYKQRVTFSDKYRWPDFTSGARNFYSSSQTIIKFTFNNIIIIIIYTKIFVHCILTEYAKCKIKVKLHVYITYIRRNNFH